MPGGVFLFVWWESFFFLVQFCGVFGFFCLFVAKNPFCCSSLMLGSENMGWKEIAFGQQK